MSQLVVNIEKKLIKSGNISMCRQLSKFITLSITGHLHNTLHY